MLIRGLLFILFAINIFVFQNTNINFSGQEKSESIRVNLDDSSLKPSAEFYFPTDGQEVERAVQCSGRVQNLEAGYHLWVVVEIDGFMWPKEPPIEPRQDGTWEVTIHEGGQPDVFSLAIYAVSNDSHGDITKWIERGKVTASYPGLRRISGARRLAEVKDLTLISN